MTEKQKEWAYAAESLIKKVPGGKDIKIYTSETFVRVQHIKINSAYRMFAICKTDSKKKIVETILRMVEEIRRETT
ncbi:MAG: hypothetical protein IJ106_10390 [Parasporobacterium sp.]|nr:hypothetical protein [Parasporobacterium sp.]